MVRSPRIDVEGVRSAVCECWGAEHPLAGQQEAKLSASRYVCVCMYIYIYIYVYICVKLHMDACVEMCIYIYIYIYICMYVLTYIFMYVFIIYRWYRHDGGGTLIMHQQRQIDIHVVFVMFVCLSISALSLFSGAACARCEWRIGLYRPEKTLE